MTRCLLSICLIPMLAWAAPAQDEDPRGPAGEATVEMERRILESDDPAEAFREAVLEAVQHWENELDARIGLYVRDERTGTEIGHNHNELFHAASTMKLPVMIEVFRQADRGWFDLDDRILVDPMCRSMLDGSLYECDSRGYVAEHLHQPVHVRKLAEEMMVVSDNLATNLLIELVTPQRITAAMRELGADDGFVIRGLQDTAAYRAGISNRITARDLVELLDAVENNRAASAESCAEMRQILRAQHYRSRLPALLPEGVQVGHKTGSISGHRHDAGTVYAPFGTYHVTILMDGLTVPNAEADGAAARLSRFIYDGRQALGTALDRQEGN